MIGPIVVLRPEPGASRTAKAAEAIGLQAIVTPLFEVRSLPWSAPHGDFDALMLTSPQAADHAGAALASFKHLPCYAVGEATAASAQAAGLDDILVGPSDLTGLLALIEEHGIGNALHLCGKDRTEAGATSVMLTHVPVYEAVAADHLSTVATEAAAAGAIVLLHSPRAGHSFASLFQGRRRAVTLAAISPATAAQVGTGWKEVAVASAPRDAALLELAARLCQTGGEREAGVEA